jgi:hypothetical protein
MSSHITIHYLGQRKDSGKGAIWGYFTEVGKPDKPKFNYYTNSPEPNVYCHVFWGRLGKKLHIECKELTIGFLDEAEAKKKNFKQVEQEKVLPRCGKDFEEEFSMYLLTLKLRG